MTWAYSRSVAYDISLPCTSCGRMLLEIPNPRTRSMRPRRTIKVKRPRRSKVSKGIKKAKMVKRSRRTFWRYFVIV